MKESLALAEGVEVVMSRVEVPKNTTLPLHFHPGEEFADDSVELVFEPLGLALDAPAMAHDAPGHL